MSLGIIAAGGKGSRMESNLPKPLTLLPDGNTFLDSMIKKVKSAVDQVVVVSNLQVMNHPKFVKDKDCFYRIQLEATGMGDAVFHASDLINEHEEILIVWCDQIGITNETLGKTLDTHRTFKSDFHMTVPLVSKETQYIHVSQSNGRIDKIHQAKEGDIVPYPSISDIGLFVFSSGSNLLLEWASGGREYSKGKLTSEYNFLPFLAYLGLNKWNFQKVDANPKDGIGVNTQKELIEGIASIQE